MEVTRSRKPFRISHGIKPSARWLAQPIGLHRFERYYYDVTNLLIKQISSQHICNHLIKYGYIHLYGFNGKNYLISTSWKQHTCWDPPLYLIDNPRFLYYTSSSMFKYNFWVSLYLVVEQIWARKKVSCFILARIRVLPYLWICDVHGRLTSQSYHYTKSIYT